MKLMIDNKGKNILFEEDYFNIFYSEGKILSKNLRFKKKYVKMLNLSFHYPKDHWQNFRIIMLIYVLLYLVKIIIEDKKRRL